MRFTRHKGNGREVKLFKITVYILQSTMSQGSSKSCKKGAHKKKTVSCSVQHHLSAVMNTSSMHAFEWQSIRCQPILQMQVSGTNVVAQ